MKIENVRLGLATNSSSSHYIVFFNGNPNSHGYYDKDVEDQEFGWNDFLAISEQTKLTYLGQIIFQNLKYDMGVEVAKSVAEKWCNDIKIDVNGYIDHQSMLGIPCKFSSTSFGCAPDLNKEFFEELKCKVLQENVGILGGNDNTDSIHPLHSELKSVKHVRGWYGNDYRFSLHQVARKDPQTGVWFLFNRKNGTRLTLSFDDVEDMRPTIPLLVDLKITDKCSYNCKYCYQGSTKEGECANLDNVLSALAAISKLEIFEIAIGGGDPTEHIAFDKILEEAHNLNVVPNFSTRNKKYIFNYLENSSKNEYGAVAYSIAGDESLRQFMRELTEKKLLDKFIDRGTIHYVMGIGYQFKDILETVRFYNIPLILLGYKTVGRGARCRPTDYSGWVKEYLEVFPKYSRVGIDTLLAQQSEQELKKHHVSKKTYSIEESDSSIYIDCVKGLIGPSSYAAPSEMEPLDLTQDSEAIAEKIVACFKKYRDLKTNVLKMFLTNRYHYNL
jgi:hypothetical protein